MRQDFAEYYSIYFMQRIELICKLASVYSLLANDEAEGEIDNLPLEISEDNDTDPIISNLQESSKVLYHWSNSEELASLNSGDSFVLNPVENRVEFL